MQRHGDGKSGFWTTKLAQLMGLYVLLLLFTSFSTLNYYEHYLAKAWAHYQQEQLTPASGAPECQAKPTKADARPPETPTFGGTLGTLFSMGSWDGALHALRSFRAPALTAPPHQEATGQPFPARACEAERQEFIYDLLNSRLHEKQSLAHSILKIRIVVVISALWFVTFLAANEFTRAWATPATLPWSARLAGMLRSPGLKRLRLPWAWPGRAGRRFFSAPVVIKSLFGLLALVPVWPFVLAMHEEYEPTVFVMALVAIFVAAEHYGGLTENVETLEEKTTALQNRLGVVLNADGLNEWRTEVYHLYGEARDRIDAVIRFFDIDPQWWKCALAKEKWQAYEEVSEKETTTLLHTLNRTRAKVQFVTDLPLRPGAVPGQPTSIEQAEFFRHVLGLVWHLVVFEKVHEARLKDLAATKDPPAYLRIKIAHAPFWMHVVDDTVYQVIERGTAGNATVRKLSESITDPIARSALERWARDNVRTVARRGGRAEEYVFSLLRSAARQAHCQDDDILTGRALLRILVRLGLGHYMRQPKEDFLLATHDDVDRRMNRTVLLSRPTAVALCKAVFEEFLRQRFSENRCQVGAWVLAPQRVRHLAGETL